MIPSSFPESNNYLNPPDGVDVNTCQVLSVWQGPSADGVPLVISCWKPTKEELEQLNRTGRIWLYVWGATMPPVALLTKHPFKPEQ